MAKRRYQQLDALRIAAALLVVLYHYCALGPSNGAIADHYPAIEPLAKYGYLGVSLFFVISGFVITLSVEGRTTSAFLLARARRLYPAFWTACLTTAAFALLLGYRSGVTPTSLAANLTLFAPYLGQESVDGVYWSLYVEVRFYLLIAVIAFAGMMDRIVTLMAIWLALSAANLIVPIPHGSGGLLLAYAPLFASGVACARFARKGFSAQDAVVFVSAVLLSIFYGVRDAASLSQANTFDLAPSVVAMFLILAHLSVLASAVVRTSTAAIPALSFLGYLSYPLYLLHNEIGKHLFPLARTALSKEAALLATIAAVIALASAVHLLVERPLGLGRPRRRRAVEAVSWPGAVTVVAPPSV